MAEAPVSAWLLDEDEAMKKKVQGLVVKDRNKDEREVPVFFREPQKEIRTQTYPFITVELSAIQRDPSREQRGEINPRGLYAIPGFETTGITDDTVSKVITPTPVNLVYNIVTYSRNPIHDRQLIWSLMRADRLPWRQGYLHVVPGDDDYGSSYRSMMLMSVNPADTKDSQSNAIFRKVFTVVVSSEILEDRVLEIQKALSIALDLRASRYIEVDENGDPVTDSPDYPYENFWSEEFVIEANDT